MNFEPLTILKHNDDILWVAGAEHGTRSDGTGSFMVAQAYSAQADFFENDILVDELGQKWRMVESIPDGFSMNGIILEEVTGE